MEATNNQPTASYTLLGPHLLVDAIAKVSLASEALDALVCLSQDERCELLAGDILCARVIDHANQLDSIESELRLALAGTVVITHKR